MLIIRKLIRSKGGSYQIFVPKDWVENLEKIKGQKIIKMRMFLNCRIKCEPIFGEGKSLGKRVRKRTPPTDDEMERLLSEMEVC